MTIAALNSRAARAKASTIEASSASAATTEAAVGSRPSNDGNGVLNWAAVRRHEEEERIELERQALAVAAARGATSAETLAADGAMDPEAMTVRPWADGEAARAEKRARLAAAAEPNPLAFSEVPTARPVGSAPPALQSLEEDDTAELLVTTDEEAGDD